MSATDRYERLDPLSVIVPEGRQRSDLSLDDEFLRSLRERGVLFPILVTSALVLVAGGRRLAGAIKVGLSGVPVRFVKDGLSDIELRLIELEENVRREELPWRDRVRATSELHRLWCTTREDWTMAKTSEELGIHTQIWLRVAKSLDDPRLVACINVRAAYNICQRLDERAADSILEDISHSQGELFSPLSPSAGLGEVSPASTGEVSVGLGTSPPSATPSPVVIQRSEPFAPIMPREDVLCVDFSEWAKTYSGPRFNLLHCDFPYGKKVFGGEWGGKNAEEDFKYDDDPEVYWKLIEALCANLDRLLTPTAHMMFWLSSEISNMHETIERFRTLAPSLIFQQRPLIWLKSCNTGITPDPERAPRWIVETALMATRGDRPLVKPLGSGYNAPTARALHPSAKPEPVLRHFFGMFVDASTRMLDPTCGAGSSLRAAESLGAGAVLGIERSEEYAKVARKALKDFRNLRELTK